MISINNEKELHYKVVDYIKNFIKEPIIIPGLGEHQINNGLRTDAYFKGYAPGQPDLILLNYHTHYKGLAIELKTPKGTGIITEKQQNYRNTLESNGFKNLISNNYDDIITTIVKYSMGIIYYHDIKVKQDTLKEYCRNYSSKKTLCSCGKEYQRGNKHHHEKSRHHQKWLEEKL